MQFTALRTFVLLAVGATLTNAVALGSVPPIEARDLALNERAADVRGTVPDTFELPEDEDFGITERGNVEDITILERDVLPEELFEEALMGRAIEKRSVKSDTDKLLFKSSLSTFLSKKKKKFPKTLIWTDDGCSKSPDRPSGFNFLHSCQRHDFGYRNYKKQKRFTSGNRKKIDDNFKKDLYKECAKYKGLKAFRGVQCRRTADIYHKAVRTFGHL